jgi:hypothetical protein
MPKGPDETTDMLFPPPESGATNVRPLPLTRSIREEFLQHRVYIDDKVKAIQTDIGLALARLSPSVTPATAGAKVKGGVLAGLKYGGVALALGEGLAALAKATGHPDAEGPIRAVLQLLNGG